MKQITFHHSKKDIFNAVLQLADNLELQVNNMSLAEGTILLEHIGNLLSYGNKIDVKIKSTQENKYIVYISSRSAAVVQLIDWGTNDRFEAKIIETLREILNR